MARATTKKRGKGKNGNGAVDEAEDVDEEAPPDEPGVPPEWQAVIDASFRQAEETAAKPAPKTGIVHENGIAYVLEPIDPVQLAKDSHELAGLIQARDKLDDDRKKVAAAFKAKLVDFKERIDTLAEEVQTGLRKRPAQQDLPLAKEQSPA